MTSLREAAAVLAALIFFAIPPGAAAASPHERAASVVDRNWPDGAGGTVMVARGGKRVMCRGLGWADRERAVPAGCDTAYDVMSMTKPFTAAAILKLEMMGRLRLSDGIGRFLDGVPADKEAITVDDLLSHTSGLVEALGDDYQPLSRREMVARAMRSRLVSSPGTDYRYSNLGYSLLAAIVEKASGTDYERFLARHVFGPAGMKDTGYVLPRWSDGQVAVEYDPKGRSQGRPFDHPWAKDGPYWNLRGNGGLLSTARDMLRWHRALLGEKVLDRDAKRELFAPRVRFTPTAAESYAGGRYETPFGPVAAHNGGNGWSFGVTARGLKRGAAVFWISNEARRSGEWNLERQEAPLLLGLLKAAVARP